MLFNDGDLIDPPEILDRLGKKVEMGDVVTFVKAYSMQKII